LLTRWKFGQGRAEVVFLFIFAVLMMLVRKPLEPSLVSMKLINSVDNLFGSKFHHQYDKDMKTTTLANADVVAKSEGAPIKHS